MELEIDYSEIKQEYKPTANSNWRPPRHVYFGKRDEDGNMAVEPVYIHQEFPRIMYAMKDEKIVARMANNEQDKLTLQSEGFEVSPAAFGYVSAPSFEQAIELKTKQEEKSEEVTEVKKPGRPKKAD